MKHTTASSRKNSEEVEAWRQEIPDAPDFSVLATNHDGRPPAYSPIPGSSSNNGHVRLCCALRDFDWGIREVSAFSGLLEQSQRLQFLYWVAIYRSRATNVPTLERLSCPLLWCRMSFDEHEKLVDHVSSCPYLDQGLYWCPDHQKSERFSEPVADGTTGCPPQNSRRHSWKAAFKAIRKLGSKGLQKAIHPSRSRKVEGRKSYGKTVESDKSDTANIQELMTEATVPELDGQYFVPTATSNRVVHEVAGAYLPFEMEATLDHAAELDSDTLSCPSMEWESTGNATPESSFSPISPVCPADRWAQRFPKDLESPISPTDSISMIPWTRDLACSREVEPQTTVQEAPPMSLLVGTSGTKGIIEKTKTIHIDTTYVNTTTFMWSTTASSSPLSLLDYAVPDGEQVTDTGMQKTAVSDNNFSDVQWYPTTAVSTVQGPAEYVEDLRDVFHILFEDTMQKLSSPSMSYNAKALTNSNLLTEQSTLENAFAALRKMLCKEPELTFWEVFGYVHLTYASAVLTNAVDLLADSRGIFSEVVKMSNTITSHDDRIAFLQLANDLWSPPTSLIKSLASGMTPVLEGSPDLNELFSGDTGTGSMTSLASTQSRDAIIPSLLDDQMLTFERVIDIDGISLGGLLRCNRAERLCLQALESIEYADIRYHTSRSNETQPDAIGLSSLRTSKDAKRSRIMREYVTEPLIMNMGLEGFMPVVLEANKLLNGVQQISLRELELKLLHEGKDCARSQILYDKFVTLVMHSCDHVSLLLGEHTTREEHYIRAIDQVLRVYHDFQHERLLSTQDLESAGQKINDISISSEIPALAGSSNVLHGSWEQFGSTPMIPLHSTTSDQSLIVDPIETQVNSPNLPNLNSAYLHHQPQSSPAVLGSPTVEPGNGSLTCTQCGKVFSGKLVWLQSNVQRHVREKHSVAKKLPCPHEKCGKMFIRKTNLNAHVRTVHNRTRDL